MNLLQQCFAVVAIPATVILLLQTILLLFGVGGGHAADHGDFAGDTASADTPEAGMDAGDTTAVDYSAQEAPQDFHDTAHHAEGLRIFTVRGIVAFFAVGGWLGVVLGETGMPMYAAILLAFLGGVAALVLTALIFKWSLSLQDQGNLNLINAVGKTAQVYIPIPPEGKGTGKVNLTMQDRYVELSAMTTSKAELARDQLVKVTGVVNQATLMVRPILEEGPSSPDSPKTNL